MNRGLYGLKGGDHELKSGCTVYAGFTGAETGETKWQGSGLLVEHKWPQSGTQRLQRE